MNDTLVAVAKEVAAIPWGEARTAEEVEKLHKGTCTGKHLLLEKRLKEAGILCRPVVCTFRWGDQKLQLPEDLEAILREGEWLHGHNFLQVKNSEGTWIDLDVTWDPALAKYGFRTLPENWDGETSFVGLTSETRWDGVSMVEKKADLINALDPRKKERRERFLKGFIPWIDSLR